MKNKSYDRQGELAVLREKELKDQEKLLAKEKSKKLFSRGLQKKILFILNLAVWIFMMFPIIYGFSMAFKPASDLFNPNAILFSKNPTFANFIEVFEVAPIDRYIINSLIVSIAITFFQIISSFLAGFSFHFKHFKGKKQIYSLILATMMIPGEAVMISQYLMVSGWGITDTLYVLILPFIVSAFNIFLCTQTLESFPDEIYEAAKVDGCSDLRFIFTILMPLTKPSIGAMAVQSFLFGWNMYTWPLLVTNADHSRTVQIGLNMLRSEDSQSLVLMVAGVMLCMIPSLLIFIFGRKNMIRGLTSGAVKG